MKKIYAIALMALLGATTANAQAFKLDKNYIIYTEHNGTDGLVDVLGVAFLDEDFNTFPVTGGNLSTVTHKLTTDYNDPETGVTIKAGEYNFISSIDEIKFKDTYNPQGLKNIKKVIVYIGGIGSNTTYTRLTQDDSQGEDYINYEGEPETNRAWSYYCAPNLEMGPNPDGDKLDDSYLTYSSPIKLTIDLTNNTDGTEEEISGHKLYVNASKTSFFQGTSGTWYCSYEEAEAGNPVTEKRMLLQFYEQGLDADNKVVKGENLIPWAADNRYSVALKKGAYIMAIAFICGDDNAETATINIKEGGDFATSGIGNIVSDTGAGKTVKAIYTIDGVKTGNLQNGINIVKYSDGTTRKVIRK